MKNLSKRVLVTFSLMMMSSANLPAHEEKKDMAGQEIFDAVVGEATDLIEQLHIPGLAVGVSHGANSYSACMAVTNVSTKEPVTADTAFHIASAGHLLSVAGGKPYETLVEEHIHRPLGMNATSFN